jgi:hypothetical protein
MLLTGAAVVDRETVDGVQAAATAITAIAE